MKKIILFSIFIVLLSFTGCRKQAEEVDVVLEKEVFVEVEELKKDMIRDEYYSLGSVKVGRTYNMNALVNADVTEVFVSVGDKVKEGDVLFELDSSDFATNRTSQLSNIKTQRDSAKIQRDFARDNYENQKTLYSQGIVSKSTLDQAENSYESAQISYSNTLTSYQTTLSTLSSSEDNYVIISPIDGIVTDRTIEENQMATTQNGVVISEYNPIKVSISIPSSKIHEIYVNQNVRVEFPGQDYTVEGVVTSLSLSSQSSNYPCEILLDNSDGILLPGMTAEVYLEIDRVESGFIVDKKMVLNDKIGDYIFIIENDKAIRVDIAIGIENGEKIQIIGDLNVSDKIVTKGQQYLENDDKVKIK